MLSFSVYANGTESRAKSFSLKKIVNDEKQLESFITQSLASYHFKTRKEVKQKLSNACEGLFFHDFVVQSPVFIDVVYKTINKPKVIVSVVKMFTQLNDLIFFVGAMGLTFIAGYVLSIFGSLFKILGPLHLMYSLSTFIGLNYIRLKLIPHYLGKYLGDFYHVVLNSLATHGDHDVILIILNIMDELV